MYPLLKLVCTDAHIIGLLVVGDEGLICTIAFVLLLISYGVILHSLKNLSPEGRRKALQTCGSHITVVVFFFVPCIFMYVRPAKTFSIDKSLSVLYSHNPHAEPPDLHSEKFWDDKCYNAAVEENVHMK